MWKLLFLVKFKINLKTNNKIQVSLQDSSAWRETSAPRQTDPRAASASEATLAVCFREGLPAGPHQSGCVSPPRAARSCKAPNRSPHLQPPTAPGVTQWAAGGIDPVVAKERGVILGILSKITHVPKTGDCCWLKTALYLRYIYFKYISLNIML